MNRPVQIEGQIEGQIEDNGDGRRTRHATRREELLEAAADYVLDAGLTSLSIRPMAAALGLSHRTLLYHFGSKDELIIEVLDLIRARDKARIRAYLAGADTSSTTELFRAAWGYFSAHDRIPYIRFFHEVLTLGLRGAPYDAWARQIVASRVGMISAALVAQGVPAKRAGPAATLIIAAVRGLQLHLLSTGDRSTTDAAFEELLSSLQTQLQR